MKDERKTKKQLTSELAALRQRVTELEAKEIDQRQAEKAVRESERLLRAIAENYPHSYVSIIEKDLTVDFTSGQEFKKQGLDPNGFVGLSLDQVFGELAPTVRKNYLRAFEGKEVTFELFINDQHQVYNVVPLFDKDGEIHRILAVVENITERKQAEEALRESEEKYRQLFELESDAIFLIDNETGRILEVNAAGSVLYGYSREELLRMKNTDLSAEPDETRKATVQEWSRVPVRFHRKKDGTVLPVEITARHFTWRGCKVHIAAIRDISERLRVEEELRKYQEHLEELVDERTAEMRKIINAMAGREVRMAELKDVIRKLRAQLEEAGLEPIADDPLLAGQEK